VVLLYHYVKKEGSKEKCEALGGKDEGRATYTYVLKFLLKCSLDALNIEASGHH